MKKIFLLLLFSCSAFAQDIPENIQEHLHENKQDDIGFIEVGEYFYQFVFKENNRLVLSKKCHQIGDECVAIQKLSTLNSVSFNSSDRLGGKEPGAILCKKHLDGEIIEGQRVGGGPLFLCRFKDGSMITTSSLDFYRWKNAQKH